MIDLGFLTEEEQKTIMSVLKRDAELKKVEEKRVQWVSKSDYLIQFINIPEIQQTKVPVQYVCSPVWTVLYITNWSIKLAHGNII